MFDYTLVHWLSFLTTAAIVVATPGPDLASILSRTIRGGRTSGLAALAGMCGGAAVHVILVTLGLGALISSSTVALAALKWIGAAYLIYLGANALFPRNSRRSKAQDSHQSKAANCFRDGMLINLLNPKAILFYVAFLPQFVVKGQGPEALQLVLHGGLVIVLAVAVYLPVVVFAGCVKTRGAGIGRFGGVLERLMAITLIGLGAKVATSG